MSSAGERPRDRSRRYGGDHRLVIVCDDQIDRRLAAIEAKLDELTK